MRTTKILQKTDAKQRQQNEIKAAAEKAAADAEIVAKRQEKDIENLSNLQTILSLGGKRVSSYI
jgi:hypothetical protein